MTDDRPDVVRDSAHMESHSVTGRIRGVCHLCNGGWMTREYPPGGRSRMEDELLLHMRDEHGYTIMVPEFDPG